MKPSRTPAPLIRVRRSAALLASATLLLTGLSTAAAVNDWSGAGRSPGLGAAAETTAEPVADPAAESAEHLLVSEVMTGGTSASDEFIELYNPGPQALPLEGLEVIYVTATGGTITRKASWASGAPSVPAGAHVLVANGSGIFAAVADITYTGGLAATGGSVAIRILGASSAVDAVGWGTAASTWMEGSPAAAAAAGHAIERLPGGAAGSGQDSDQNSVDFAEIATPDPQNTLSAPIPVGTQAPSPSPTSSPTSGATVTPPPGTPSSTASPSSTPDGSQIPTSIPTQSPTPEPTAVPLTIAAARSLPDGAAVVVEGVTLTGSTFSDGGGYLADASGGIAVLVSDGTFPRGMSVRIGGTLDQRFSQRTIRAEASGVIVVGPAAGPNAQSTGTGSVGESVEGELVEVVGNVVSSQTVLSTGIAVDLDDGSGAVRILAGSETGIDTSGWQRGAQLRLHGVVGQRDSTGSGSVGYRVQPRDALDVASIVPPASSSPSPVGSGSASPAPSGDSSLLSIAEARAAPFNARVRVRGIVTLPSGLAEAGSAAIQDSSAAILLRLGDEAGSLRAGELVEVFGTRSTKAGMETIRVTDPPRRLGSQSQPDPRRRATGSLGEKDEAMLIVVRGAVTITPRRTSAENVYFDLDDGSGPVRVFISPRSGIGTDTLLLGSWLDLAGVLGQETTGKLPDRGYRIWPRTAGDLRIVASAAAGASAGGESPLGTGGGTGLSGGGSGAGAEASSAKPAAQQGVPRLAHAIATPPAPAILPAVPRASGGATPDPSPSPAAAGLLALAGLLLGGAGAAVGRPGLAERLRGAIGDRAGDQVTEEEDDPDALPRLVPLTVLDGSPAGEHGAAPRAPSGPHAGSGRILPPT